MEDRSAKITHLRPKINSLNFQINTLVEESFQNLSLRPILKFQNNLLIKVLKQYFFKHKNTFYSLSLEKRLLYIEQAVQKDSKFRNVLKGIIIGLFTEEEYDFYIKNSTALNKRMMSMLVERYQSQIQIFEKP